MLYTHRHDFLSFFFNFENENEKKNDEKDLKLWEEKKFFKIYFF